LGGTESGRIGEKTRGDLLKNILEKVKEYKQREILRLLPANTRKM